MPPQNRSLRHWSATPGVVFRERAYAPGGAIERHAHRHTTLIVVLEGAFDEDCDGRMLARRPGELHVLPGDLPHSTAVHATGARVFLVGLYDDWLTRSVERRHAVEHATAIPRGTRAADLGRQMYEEFLAGDVAAGLALEGLLLETLALLLRARTRPPSPRTPLWLTNARDRLRDECTAPPAIADLAAAAGVSAGHLYRAFRERFRCTPGAWVRRARIANVKRLLRESSEPISRIACEAGFGDQAHLTRCFRAQVGMTPGAWRRLHASREVSHDQPG